MAGPETMTKVDDCNRRVYRKSDMAVRHAFPSHMAVLAGNTTASHARHVKCRHNVDLWQYLSRGSGKLC
jgi:hypothetical protein